MVTRNIVEAASLVAAPSEGDTWKVRLINEGRGSSGIYSAELLENYGHAFNGAISFLNHPTDGPESRNFTEIVGRVVGETWLDRAEDGTLGVYANWEPDEDYKRKLAKYRENLGLSIYISGSGEVDDNGDFRVTEFDASDPFRSVDVVLAAGRGGRFEESLKKIYEHRNDAVSEKATTTAVEERKDKNMDEVTKALEALTAQVSALVASRKTEAEESAQREADAQAVEAAVSAYDAAVTAIEAADLLAPQVESLRAAARAGQDVTPMIESAKAVKAAAIESIRVEESAGRDFGGVKDVQFTGFGGKK
jgi:hypothetical protein